ncbi:MAG TPA: OmpH family outer membrane protein [Pyrinomonadaceae bacterium]|jgi:Skp family chaperone for outer membrane proteins
MKRILVIAPFFALLTASASVLAQTRPTTPSPVTAKPVATQPTPRVTATVPDTKIALVDTSMFGDEKAGITRYLNAVKTVQRQFQPVNAELVGLQNRIKAIADELAKLNNSSVVSPQTIQAKREEGERLQRELKYKKEQADADVEKRYNELVSPVSADIGKALEQYASQHGLTMILDISKLLPAVLTLNPAMDVTQAFIAEYNSRNP